MARIMLKFMSDVQRLSRRGFTDGWGFSEQRKVGRVAMCLDKCDEMKRWIVRRRNTQNSKVGVWRL